MKLIKYLAPFSLLITSSVTFAGGGCEWEYKDTKSWNIASKEIRQLHYGCVLPKYEIKPNSLDAKLMADLSRPDLLMVVREWVDDYERLEPKFKNTVHLRAHKTVSIHSGKDQRTNENLFSIDEWTNEERSYDMSYGDLYGLQRGIGWGGSVCPVGDGKNDAGKFADPIDNEFWGGGKHGVGSKTETDGYRAAMVYHYIRYQLLQCG